MACFCVNFQPLKVFWQLIVSNFLGIVYGLSRPKRVCNNISSNHFFRPYKIKVFFWHCPCGIIVLEIAGSKKSFSVFWKVVFKLIRIGYRIWFGLKRHTLVAFSSRKIGWYTCKLKFLVTLWTPEMAIFVIFKIQKIVFWTFQNLMEVLSEWCDLVFCLKGKYFGIF